MLVSLALLGIQTHISFITKIISHQSTQRMMSEFVERNFNSSISGIFFRLFEVLNLNPDFQPIFFNILTVIKAALFVLVLYYLFCLSKKQNITKSKEFGILTFSLITAATLSLLNYASASYPIYLVLPFLLCVFVLRLDPFEKSLLYFALMLFSFHAPIMYLFGNVPVIYLLNPATMGNVLFLMFVLRRTVKFKKTTLS